MAQRNPYIILGLPYGASREQANVAFARKAKALRRAGAAGKDRLTDLTWALNQLDEGTADPRTDLLTYRVPADPDVFYAPGEGVCLPPAEPMPPRPGDREAALRKLRAAAANELLRYLVLQRSIQVEEPAP